VVKIRCVMVRLIVKQVRGKLAKAGNQGISNQTVSS
jgi:hypothetical protein